MSVAACSDPAHSEAARRAEERANLYGLLAAIFRAPVKPDMLAAFRDQPLRDALRVAGVELDGELDPERQSEVLDELAVDFTQLFHGPSGQIVPYESIHVGRPEDRELLGRVSQDVGRVYAGAGFDPGEAANTPPDFLATELEFLAELARRESLAWIEFGTTLAKRQRALAGDFLRRHLGLWAEPFAEKVAARAETRFYRQFAGLLAAFLAGEAIELSGGLAEDVPQETERDH